MGGLKASNGCDCSPPSTALLSSLSWSSLGVLTMQPGKTASLLQQPVREQRELDANSNPLASEILAFGDRLFYSIPLSSCLPLARHRHRHRGRESGVGIDFLAGRYRYRFPTPMPMPTSTGSEAAPRERTDPHAAASTRSTSADHTGGPEHQHPPNPSKCSQAVLTVQIEPTL